jgi:hypothetical protein
MWLQQLKQRVIWSSNSYTNVIAITFIMVRSPSWKTVVPLLGKKFFAFCETWIFTTLFTTARHILYPQRYKWILRPPTLHNIQLNTLPPTPRPSQWSLSCSFPHPVTVSISLTPTKVTCHARVRPFYFVTRITLGEEHEPRSSLRSFLQSLPTPPSPSARCTRSPSACAQRPESYMSCETDSQREACPSARSASGSI